MSCNPMQSRNHSVSRACAISGQNASLIAALAHTGNTKEDLCECDCVYLDCIIVIIIYMQGQGRNLCSPSHVKRLSQVQKPTRAHWLVKHLHVGSTFFTELALLASSKISEVTPLSEVILHKKLRWSYMDLCLVNSWELEVPYISFCPHHTWKFSEFD